MSDALLEAIQSRDVDRVAKLLAAGADPNEPGKSRYGRGGNLPPLHAAIGELEAFEAIGSDAPVPEGPIDSVVLLLRHGARASGWNISKEGDPLLDAVLGNHIEAVQLLLAAGADPNVSDGEGTSPLRVCADKGYLEMARLLLLCGATRTIEEWGGGRPMTALGFAARGLHVDLVKLLLAHGADPQGKNVDDLTPLDCLEFVDSPEDPADQERLREIRRLLGDPSASC
ncbi:MAG: ankyrin repeat domain-containing protein [Polyangiaceae bacterium]|nr:ankyrin repeat domain-containing protein [Polyangiaceae bacterium]